MKNAMLDAIDGKYIANKIRMERSQHAGAFLVVEGVSDKRFFERFVDKGRCKVVAAHGRENALDAFHRLQSSAFAGALFIVDADFDALEGRLPLPVGLLFTDTHDLETMLFASPALDKVLIEVVQGSKSDKFRADHGDVRTWLLERGKPLGYLLWLSRTDGLALDFEELKFSKFIDDKTLALDLAKMIKAVTDHSQRHDLTAAALLPKLASMHDDQDDPWHVCCGHHLTEILALALRKVLATNNATALDAGQIEQMLRLAYEDAHFVATQLCASIRTWESLHSPFVVLR